MGRICIEKVLLVFNEKAIDQIILYKKRTKMSLNNIYARKFRLVKPVK